MWFYFIICLVCDEYGVEVVDFEEEFFSVDVFM